MNQWTHDHTWEVIKTSPHAVEKHCGGCGMSLSIGCGGCPACRPETLPLALLDKDGNSAVSIGTTDNGQQFHFS